MLVVKSPDGPARLDEASEKSAVRERHHDGVAERRSVHGIGDRAGEMIPAGGREHGGQVVAHLRAVGAADPGVLLAEATVGTGSPHLRVPLSSIVHVCTSPAVTARPSAGPEAHAREAVAHLAGGVARLVA